MEKVLTRFEEMDCKTVSVPYDLLHKLSKNKGALVDQLKCSQIIGSLMYLSSATRLDILYGVSRLTCYTSRPGDRHWVALFRIIRYLKGTINIGIKYTRYPSVLEGFTNADWISDSDKMKATSDYVFTLEGGPCHGDLKH